ncbi:mitogen-activated protein kinase kinase kinase 3 [Biomphalaria glabrata]|nr:mitogen-activated protein kinase kinase kinase 3 [Biomphalaria glabrata]
MLNREDLECLQENFIYLRDELEADSVANFLFQNKEINFADLERIRAAHTRVDRADILLRTILNSRPGAFPVFLQSLEKYQGHVLEQLNYKVGNKKVFKSVKGNKQEKDQNSELLVPQCWTKAKDETLGQGKFGKIYLCCESNSFFLFALKEIKLDRTNKEIETELECMRNEMKILGGLRHERIVQYYGCQKEDITFRIFLEYMPGRSVFDHLKKFDRMTESATAKVTKQVLEGLAFLHSNDIVHRDIKASNILRDVIGNIKLSDFGISKHLTGVTSTAGMNTAEGSSYWMAPEVIRGSGYGRNADLWSVGCTVVEMMTKEPPFYKLKPATAIYKIGQGESPIYELPADSTDNVKAFLSITFQPKSSDRTSAQRLLKHDFVKYVL